MEYYKKILQYFIIDERNLSRKKINEYKIRFNLNTRDGVKGMTLFLRRNELYDIRNEDMLETLAFLCCAGIGDISNYKEFYDTITDYPYSKKDYDFHVEVKNKTEKFLGGEAELERFINEYTDWLKDGEFNYD